MQHPTNKERIDLVEQTITWWTHRIRHMTKPPKSKLAIVGKTINNRIKWEDREVRRTMDGYLD